MCTHSQGILAAAGNPASEQPDGSPVAVDVNVERGRRLPEARHLLDAWPLPTGAENTYLIKLPLNERHAPTRIKMYVGDPVRVVTPIQVAREYTAITIDLFYHSYMS